MTDASALRDGIAGLRLVDHHVHPAMAGDLAASEFAALITESDRALPPPLSPFDCQLGIAIRRWCAPLLGLEPFASPAAYLARRASLGGGVVTGRLLAAAGVSDFLADTGYLLPGMASLDDLAAVSGARCAEIVRLETVAEQVIGAGDASAAGFASRFAAALGERAARAVGLKSIIAYRAGLDFDPAPPGAAEVTAAAGRWLRQIRDNSKPGEDSKPAGRPPDTSKPDNSKPDTSKPDTSKPGGGGPVRLADPVLLRHLLWAGLELRLPVQLHTGFGDPDLDLRRCDPLLLRGFLRLTEPLGVPVLLLHCYPYHRQAGYLAQAFGHVHLDVGLAINHTGARAAAVVAESLELAPFGKVLYSSDAFGPPELHYLGALLWRQAATRVLSGWVEAGDWNVAEALRVAEMIGAGNARRVYQLAGP